MKLAVFTAFLAFGACIANVQAVTVNLNDLDLGEQGGFAFNDLDPDAINPNTSNAVLNDGVVRFSLNGGDTVRVNLDPVTSTGSDSPLASTDLRLRVIGNGGAIIQGEIGFDPMGDTFTISGLNTTDNFALQLRFVGDGTAGNGTFSASGTLTAVPLPAAAYLFGTAILGLVASTRRRQRS